MREKQPIMRDTVMVKCEGYLGPFNPKLQVGDTQRIFFQPEDVGPFWMTNQERERKHHDFIKPGMKLVKRTKKELIQLLKDKGIDTMGKADEIKKTTENHGILTMIKEVKKEEGWVGKPKGMLQIIWQ